MKLFTIKTLCLTALLCSGYAFGMDQTPTFPRTLTSSYSPNPARQLQFGESPELYDPPTRAYRWGTTPPRIVQPVLSVLVITPQKSPIALAPTVNESPIDSAQAAARYQALRDRRFANADQLAVAVFENPFFIGMLAPILNAPTRPVRQTNMTDAEYYQFLRNQHNNNNNKN